MSRTSLVAAAVAAAALTAVAPAAAAPTLERARCAEDLPQRTQCSTLTVPLDRSGTVPGTIDLPIRVVPGRGPTRRGPLILLSGGPGQAGLSPPGYLRAVMSWAPGYDVVELDQRGTGRVALRCRALDADEDESLDEAADETPRQAARQTGRCARQLGAKRRFFTSADSAADLDDLRAALGAEAITLGGTSYGTWVTQVYARLYPQRVRRIVLDSVVGPEGISGIPLDELEGARRILAAQCAGGACRGITGDLLADTARLNAELQRRKLRGAIVAPNGRRQPLAVGGRSMPSLLQTVYLQGDMDPVLRAAFPAAVAAALAGDDAPMLRLLGKLAAGSARSYGPEEDSSALYAATTCAEARLPWLPADGYGARRAKAQAALAAVPAEQLAPWGAAAVLVGPQLNGCLLWPDSPIAGPPAAPLPDVPALILNGLDDVRTPIESARAVAAQLPQATVVEIPGQGHSTLAQPCARRALERFLAGRPVAADVCADAPEAPSLWPVPPRSLKAVPGRGDARRTAKAVQLTVRDMAAAIGLFQMGQRFGGLRGGSAIARPAEHGPVLKLDGYVYVPGVRVSGTLRVAERDGVLRVGGRRSGRGRLVVRDGVARGRLGGQRVRVTVIRHPGQARAATPRAIAAAVR